MFGPPGFLEEEELASYGPYQWGKSSLIYLQELLVEKTERFLVG